MLTFLVNPTVRSSNLCRRPLPASLLIYSLLIFIMALPVKGESTLGTAGVEITHLRGSTRILLRLESATDMRVSQRGGGEMVLRFKETSFPRLRRLRGHGDERLLRLDLVRRGSETIMTLVPRGGMGIRGPYRLQSGLFILDVAVGKGGGTKEDALPGREEIAKGVRQLLQSYAPLLTSDIPFTPTDVRDAYDLLGPVDGRQFMVAEGLIYKGKGAESAGMLQALSPTKGAATALVNGRLGEALYLCQEYRQAQKAFLLADDIKGEWLSPTAQFAYGDTIARCGDYRQGRRRMTRLIARVAHTSFAPLLLVRLGDMAAREGRISEALFIYRQVDEHFPGGNGALMARLRSTDQELLTFQPDALPELRSRYRRVFEEAADMRLHEEALFKEALAEALFAPLPKALAAAEEYEQSYPRGVWQPIIRSQREELLRLRFQELRQANDCTGAITLLRPNSQFLDAAVTDTAFVPAVSACFQQLGLVAEERDLFLSLLKRHGNSPVAPLMLAQVVTNDLLMGDLQQGVDSASQFRQLYPADPRRQRVTEQLAQAQFSLGRYAEVVSLLQPFMAGGKGPETPESYYFLGRALLQQGNQRQGGDVLRRYLDATAGSSSPYRLDSYALRARALASQGNYGAALAESQTGLATGGERSDEFRYLVAWNLIRLQRTDEGRSQLQHLAKQGVDPVWRRLAQEGLAHLPELPLTPLPSAVSK